MGHGVPPIGERGLHGSTMQNVVHESGLSVGAIYTYFRGKDEPFMAARELAAGRGLGELAARLVAGRTTVDKLAIGVAFFFDAAKGGDANLAGNAQFPHPGLGAGGCGAGGTGKCSWAGASNW